MVRKIRVKNFYSIRDEQVLDFTTNKKNSSAYFQTYDGKQITKVAGFIGPNGSGKTNIMKLFGFLSFFLTISNRDENTNDTCFKSHAFINSSDSEFDIEFESDKNLFFYNLILNQNEVITEKLTYKELKKGSRVQVIFSRNKKNISFNKKVVSGVTAKQLGSIRSDVSVVAFVQANYEQPIITEVYDYFRKYWVNVGEQGDIFSLEERIDDHAKLYAKDSNLKNAMEEFVKNFDIGIDGFDIQVSSQKKAKIESKHLVFGKEFKLPFEYESRGTKSLFVELLPILSCIATGTVLVIDEIETGLHPQAVDKIIQFIIDEFSNQKRQFIFTSHSINFLKKFDSQQVFLLEKENSASALFRLDELDVRPDENFYSKYMSGAYGAFPKIRI